MASETLHEDAATLGPEIIDQHRAIASLMEELEAVDWYNQRAKATTDDELRGILEHNRDEEKEHAAMVLEWLRRHDAKLDKNLKTYLLTDKPILQEEAAAESAGAAAAPLSGSLNIGDLRKPVRPGASKSGSQS
ncbi:MAG TPA: encapsulin-associated ferritin-like protein [Stellaceae bacterium]